MAPDAYPREPSLKRICVIKLGGDDEFEITIDKTEFCRGQHDRRHHTTPYNLIIKIRREPTSLFVDEIIRTNSTVFFKIRHLGAIAREIHSPRIMRDAAVVSPDLRCL